MAIQPEVKAGFATGLWNFLASVKLTVVVLLCLAVLSSFGTFIPQNESPADYQKAFGPFLYRVLSTLDLFDMYHAWWFRLFIVALAVNIIVCSIDRLQSGWKIIFTRNPKFNPRQFRQRAGARQFSVVAAPGLLENSCRAALTKAIGACRVLETEDGFALAAESGRWTRLGVYIVHLSVVVLLAGGLIGSIFGFEGYVNIPEGQSADTIQLRNAMLTQKLPFTIRCDDFEKQTYDTGAPKEYRSKLTLLENGREILKKEIVVNDPLRYKGINIFQSSFGEVGGAAAANPQSLGKSDDIDLSFRSAASGMIYTSKATLGQVVEIPEGLGRLVVESYTAQGRFENMELGPMLTATLTPAQGPSQTILLPLKFPKFDGMRRGEVIITASVASAAGGPVYYTGLQVTRDPGVWLVYTGFLLMIAGCGITFFLSHRQMVIDLRPDGGGAVVTVSGTANKNKLGMQTKVDRLADQLRATCTALYP